MPDSRLVPGSNYRSDTAALSMALPTGHTAQIVLWRWPGPVERLRPYATSPPPRRTQHLSLTRISYLCRLKSALKSSGHLSLGRFSYGFGTVSGANSRAVTSPVGADRRIPTWASQVVSGLARDRPAVVTKEDVAQRLAEAGCERAPDSAVRELRRIGWLVQLAVKGTWAFIPPGEDAVSDPYLPLRSWLARDQNAGFMLAGASTAWHLGYLDRQPDGRIPILAAAGHTAPGRPGAACVCRAHPLGLG